MPGLVPALRWYVGEDILVSGGKFRGAGHGAHDKDQDRLVVDKWRYRTERPGVGDVVMLLYPLRPEKSFVKRVIGQQGDLVRIVDGMVFRNDVPIDDSYVPAEYRSHDDSGPQIVPEGYYFVMGRRSQQQLRQPPVGVRPGQVHRR